MVLFRIRKRDVPVYEKDCRMWAREAARHPGFVEYKTLYRVNEKDQYASFYGWKARRFHDRFMKKHHDRLVALSKCPVTVLGYYNFET
jgi:hypothetical protein